MGHARALMIGLVVVGCGRTDEVGQRMQQLDAYCEATVVGTGLVDVETDYLPNVVNCENGAADFEALKVQAVSARSYLYYKLDTSGEIGDGTGDQVYSCAREPGPDHLAAVAETAGQVLRYRDVQVAAFYVAGAHQVGPACTGGSDDPTNTEHYVTYNQGNSGDDLVQTTLGWVDPGNYANRGCMSQNGSHCLAAQGWDYAAILPFYYGEDIELVAAEGPCVAVVGDVDGGASSSDAGTSVGDDAATGTNGNDNSGLLGGCSAGSRGGAGSGWLLLFVAACLLRLRRRESA